MKNTNSLSLIVVALVIGAITISGIVFGGKEIINNTIDTSTVERISETPQSVAEQKLGGLVEVFQKMFPEGIIIGTKDKGQTGVQQIITDSSNNIYIGSSTDATFKIGTDGRITMRNTNFVTSTLNWGGDFSVGGTTFYAVNATNTVGFGTTTPSYNLEVVSADTAVVAITSTSTENDPVLRFNIGYRGATRAWSLFVDNSDSDKLKFATSSDMDLLTLDSAGRVAILKGLSVASSTLSGELSVSGKSFFATTTVETLIGGGSVLSTTTADVGKLTASEVCSNSIIRANPMHATTLRFPSTTTLATNCLPNVGDWKWLRIENVTSTDNDASIITMATFDVTSATDGGGWRLQSASSTGESFSERGAVNILIIRSTNNTTTASIFPELDND